MYLRGFLAKILHNLNGRYNLLEIDRLQNQHTIGIGIDGTDVFPMEIARKSHLQISYNYFIDISFLMYFMIAPLLCTRSTQNPVQIVTDWSMFENISPKKGRRCNLAACNAD